MSELNLYELSNALEKIEEMSDDDTSLLEYLDSVQMQVADKINNIVRFRRTTELTVEAIRNEEERLEKLRKLYENRNKRLKAYLAYCLKKMGKDKFESEVAKINFRKSDTIVIDDISKLPKEFVSEKTTFSANKTAIKEAIKKGIVVEGAHLETNENLIIK